MKIRENQAIPRIGVATIVINDGKFLLGKRKGAHGEGEWACPGGHLEFGESVEECARRELLEETGLKVLSMRLGPWVENIFDDHKHYVTLFVFVEQFEGELRLVEPHKCEVWEWYKWDSLPSPIFPTISSFIEKMGLSELSKL